VGRVGRLQRTLRHRHSGRHTLGGRARSAATGLPDSMRKAYVAGRVRVEVVGEGSKHIDRQPVVRKVPAGWGGVGGSGCCVALAPRCAVLCCALVVYPLGGMHLN